MTMVQLTIMEMVVKKKNNKNVFDYEVLNAILLT